MDGLERTYEHGLRRIDESMLKLKCGYGLQSLIRKIYQCIYAMMMSRFLEMVVHKIMITLKTINGCMHCMKIKVEWC